ncbi:MAG: protein kinase [Pirellulales bacterium]|nr:protein kinase [Pirellulales bacterium]
MRPSPPKDLVSLLENLQLASPAQVAAAARRARRLARGLPLLQSVWVDTLARMRVLTPFQAAEINAGRGEDLRVGPYVLFRRQTGLGFADVYQALHLETGTFWHLATFRPPPDRTAEMIDRLERLTAASETLPREGIAPIEACGNDAGQLWAACQPSRGPSAADWMIRHGRFPPEAVLEIARGMMPGLVALEAAGLCHADLRAATLRFDEDRHGKTIDPWLPFPGLRAVVRPREGYAHVDLPPEAFDGLAPERVRNARTPNTASDVYACGCLWWHLLTGRDPLPGGDGLTKLQAAEKASVADPKPLAPDAPETLLTAIRACTQPAPELRPAGMAELTTLLGPATRDGATCLRRTLARDLQRTPRWKAPARPSHGVRRTALRIGAAAVCAVVLVALVWGVPRRDKLSSSSSKTEPTATSPTTTTEPPRTVPVVVPTGHAEPVAADPPELTNWPTETPPRIVPENDDSRPQDLVLQIDEHPEASRVVARLPLRPGQHVHGPPGKRVVLNVAREGLLVAAPGVVFEGIDFVWKHATGASADDSRPAMVLIQSPQAEFRGCTFRSSRRTVDAVRWIHPSEETRSATSLPNGRITVDRCVFRNLDTAVDCRTRGALAIRFSNVLHLGAGPLLRLRRAPEADEPAILALDRTTLRDSGPLLRCDAPSNGSAGKITLKTNGCVFSPRADQPLLLLAGKPLPEQLLKRMTWTGQGSVVNPDCAIVGYLDDSGEARPLPENVLSIDGLVRGQVEFAGDLHGPSTDSRAVQWLAPLQSDEAPGIDGSLPPE